MILRLGCKKLKRTFRFEVMFVQSMLVSSDVGSGGCLRVWFSPSFETLLKSSDEKLRAYDRINGYLGLVFSLILLSDVSIYERMPCKMEEQKFS